VKDLSAEKTIQRGLKIYKDCCC